MLLHLPQHNKAAKQQPLGSLLRPMGSFNYHAARTTSVIASTQACYGLQRHLQLLLRGQPLVAAAANARRAPDACKGGCPS